MTNAGDRSHPAYPFTAIVGQERLRLALVLNAIDPRIGGVLIRGEKGTAKSTMARSLADLLPDLRIVEDCPYGCDPDGPVEHEHDAAHPATGPLAAVSRPMRVVELPLNTTEDRLIGTLDVQAALAHGQYRFAPGLLAAANRGILYVDEVNLLPDHLVDLVLDAAAMGRNIVEREGVSRSHPARFILIGTMNPEEGDLRPQLLDRFGLCVDVRGLSDIDARVEVMRRRAACETDAAAFARDWQPAQLALRDQIIAGRRLLADVSVSDEMLRLVAGLAVAMEVDGHRADLVIMRTARAIAALDGRDAVTRDDVRRAAELALPHRTRRRPLEPERFTEERLQEAMDRLAPPPDAPDAEEGRPDGDPPDSPPSGPDASPPPEPPAPRPSAPLALPALDLVRDRTPRTSAGRRQRTLAGDQRGRAVRTEIPHGPPADIALGATVRAAAVRAAAHTGARGAAHGGNGPVLAVRPEDVRVTVRERRVGTHIVLIVDASGSMGARQRMEAAKGAALTLLTDAYQRRDRVALIAFRARAAETLLPFTDSVASVQGRLARLPTGGRTPLAAGVRAGVDLLRQVQLKEPRALCIPVLITDGKANVAIAGGSPVEDALAAAAELCRPGVHPLVLDTENDVLSFGLAARLADAAGARYVRLADLSAGGIVASVAAVAADATA